MKRAVRTLSISLALVAALSLGACYSASVENDGSYKFGRGVPERERDLVRAGVDAMEAWLAAEGDVHLKRLSVEVDDNINTLVSRYMYAHPNDDPVVVAQWFVSGGAVAFGDVIYIYTGPQWEGYEDWQKSLVAAHEVFHVAQFGFLFDDLWRSEDGDVDYPPAWLTEGGADYAAAKALDAAGIHSYDEIRSGVAERARYYPLPLAEVTSSTGDNASGQAAPYAVGFLAAEQLALEHGNAALFDFWDALASDGSWRRAFQTAYDVSVESFVLDFDAGRANDAVPDGGVKGRLARENGDGVPGADVAACNTETFECIPTFTAEDGTFELALPEGTYEVVWRVATRESSESGTFELDGKPVDALVVGTEVVEGLEATVRKPL